MNTLPSPYYDRDGVVIYCADSSELLPLIDKHDLLLTDPPYGIGADDRSRILSRSNAAKARDYGEGGGWDASAPTDQHLSLARSKCDMQIVFGGNYFNLPPSRYWLVWDKLNGANDFADCELAWTNLDKAVRRIAYRWAGMLQQNMREKDVRWHPTQKPTAVMEWCISHAPTAKTVLDPWMGAGTTLVAARNKGLRATGIEIDERYCAAAVERLRQGVLLPT